METGPLSLYGSTLLGMFNRSVPQLTGPVSAMLLGAAYVPNRVAHSEFSDVSAYEVSGYSYARRAVTGQMLSMTEGTLAFTTDDIAFGDPVSFGPVKYLAFVFGHPAGLTADSPLLGYLDLRPSGAGVEAQNSSFTISPPQSGWFTLTSA